MRSALQQRFAIAGVFDDMPGKSRRSAESSIHESDLLKALLARAIAPDGSFLASVGEDNALIRPLGDPPQGGSASLSQKKGVTPDKCWAGMPYLAREVTPCLNALSTGF